MSRIFKYGLTGIVLLSALACSVDTDKKAKLNPLDSHAMSESSALFFKNVRQYYYQVQQDAVSGRELLRFDDRWEDETVPFVNVLLLRDAPNRKAYLMLEPNEQFEVPYAIQAVRRPLSGAADTLTYEAGTLDEQLDFALYLYDGIQQQDSLFFLVGADSAVQIFKDQDQIDAFRIPMLDYLRLVEAVR